MSPPQVALVAGFLVFAGGLFYAIGAPSLIVDAGLLVMGYALCADN